MRGRTNSSVEYILVEDQSDVSEGLEVKELIVLVSECGAGRVNTYVNFYTQVSLSHESE